MWAHPISTTVGLTPVPALCPYLPKIVLASPLYHIQSGYPQNTSYILDKKCLCIGFFSQRFPNLRFSTLQCPIFHIFLPQNPQTRVQFPLIHVPAQVNSPLCLMRNFFLENPFALFACKFWGKIPGFIFFPQVHFSTLCIHFWKVSLCLSSRPLTSSTFPSSAWAHSIEL